MSSSKAGTVSGSAGTMKTAIRIFGSVLLLAVGVASPAAADSDVLLLGVGLVDQKAIGEAPNVSVGIEHDASPIFAAGAMAGLFSKDERCCRSKSETTYVLGFVKARIPRDGIRPFAELGGGLYIVDNVLGSDSQLGWFGGMGLETPERRNLSLAIAARYHGVERPDLGPLINFKEIQLALRCRL